MDVTNRRCFVTIAVPYGPYFDHVLPYWNATKTNPDGHILWLSYEEMHKDPYESVRRIAKFLGRTLTDEQVPSLLF